MKPELHFDKIEDELAKIDFPFSYRNITLDGQRPEGFVLGLTKQRFKQTLHVSKFTKKYPVLYTLICDCMEKLAPNFKFTSIQVNKNVLCKPHKDVFNKGDSVIFGLGAYSNGGELVINSVPYDINRKLLLFDGSKNIHWVNDWEFGDRYTITCYNILTSN